MSSFIVDNEVFTKLESESAGRKLFDRIGGRAVIERVHKLFYDRIYGHAWIGQFFSGINQSHIENQQTDFMAQLFGGPKAYSGRMPIDAHMHMFITEELFELRQTLLTASLVEAGVPEAERTDWLRLDAAFKKVILKASVEECRGRYKTDPILAPPRPATLSKAG
jgi:hemoglobin